MQQEDSWVFGGPTLRVYPDFTLPDGRAHLVTFGLSREKQLQTEVLVASGQLETKRLEALEHLSSAYCEERQIALLDLWYYEEREYLTMHSMETSPIQYHRARFALSKRGCTVADGYEAAADLAGLDALTDGSGLTALQPVLRVLQAGRPDLLIGHYESEFLECKKRHYDLSDNRRQLELAKDVAALGNSGQDGVIVVGLSTKSDEVGDRIRKVTPVTAEVNGQQYRRVIERLIYPKFDGLAIDLVPLAKRPDHYVLLIRVPAQNEALMPFLVSGAIIDEQLAGSFITLVERRGDETVHARPEAIHAALSASRKQVSRW